MGTSTDALLGKARVYLGAPRNYGPSDEELAAKAAVVEAEKRKADEADAALRQKQAEDEAAEKKRLACLREVADWGAFLATVE